MEHEEGDTVKWEDFIKYPNLICRMPREVRDIFGTLQELVPPTWYYDRLGTYLHWRETALKLGLITLNEISKMNNEMIHGCGGL